MKENNEHLKNADEITNGELDSKESAKSTKVDYKQVIYALVLLGIVMTIVAIIYIKIDRKGTLDNIPNKKEVTVINNGKEEKVRIVEIYDLIHRMSNTIIIADKNQIWGKEKITIEKIDYVIEAVKLEDKYAYEEILKWKEKDFSNAKDLHNYVWRKLDGNIGKAIENDENKINELIKKLN